MFFPQDFSFKFLDIENNSSTVQVLFHLGKNNLNITTGMKALFFILAVKPPDRRTHCIGRWGGYFERHTERLCLHLLAPG